MLNEPNLRKLAEYLAKLPDNYAAFDMEVYFAHKDYRSDTIPILENGVEKNYALRNGGVDKCGAVACAIGHGPSAGVLVPEHMTTDTGAVHWTHYVDEFFIKGYLSSYGGMPSSLAYKWMFDYHWGNVDNTPHGAAKRILWLLEHGVDALPVDENGYFAIGPELVLLYA